MLNGSAWPANRGRGGMDDTTGRAGSAGIGAVIPAPWWVEVGSADARLGEQIAVVATGAAVGVAELLAQALRELTGFAVPVHPDGPGIRLTLDGADDGDEGYRLSVGPSGIVITAPAAAGLF